MLKIKNKQVEIGILETSSQNRSILGFFFKNAGKSVFKEVMLDESTALIVDYDYPGAKEKWEESYNLTQKPGIIISIKEVDLPATIWVSKPISSKALLEAGMKLQILINEDIQEETLEAEVMMQSVETVTKKESIIETPINYDISIEEFNTEPEKSETIEEPTSSLDSVKLDNVKFENDFEHNHNNDVNLTKALSESELLDTVPEVFDSVDDDESSAEIIEEDFVENSLVENQDEIESLLSEQSTEGDLNTVDDRDLDISLENNLLQTDDSINDTAEGMPSLEVETMKEHSSALNEVDALLESLIEQSDKEETSQIELIDVEEPEQNDSIIMAEEEEILPTELTELSMAYEDEEKGDNSKPIITHEGSSIELNSLPERNANDVPLSPEDELQALLDEIRQEAEVTKSIAKPAAAANVDETRTDYIPSAAEDRWAFTCGTNLLFTKKNSEKTTFNLNNHLLFLLTDTIAMCRESEKIMRIKYHDHDIVICTSKEVIYCDSSIYSEEYAEMCFEPITDDDIKVHSLDKSEVRMFRTKMDNEPENTHTLESFMWTTGLVTSRGRITSETDMDQSISLKHWPDITRLEVIPNAMRISAIFSKHPGSLKDLIKWLRVEQRYVLAFYNAALALDLIEFDQDKFRTPSSSKKSTKNRGFFSRLLKRISN